MTLKRSIFSALIAIFSTYGISHAANEQSNTKLIIPAHIFNGYMAQWLQHKPETDPKISDYLQIMAKEGVTSQIFWNSITDKLKTVKGKIYCPFESQTLSSNDVKHLTRDTIQANPNFADQPTIYVALAAVANVFPCPTK